MTKAEQKRYNALLQRVTDIYSGVVGSEWDDFEDFIGASLLPGLARAIAELLIPDRFFERCVEVGCCGTFIEVGHWMTKLENPKECADWLWFMFYYDGGGK